MGARRKSQEDEVKLGSDIFFTKIFIQFCLYDLKRVNTADQLAHTHCSIKVKQSSSSILMKIDSRNTLKVEK